MTRIRYRRSLVTAIMMAILSISPALAQKDFNVWCFGDSTGLDFNTVGLVPTPISGTSLYAGEGVASVADRFTGRLLFYCDGETAWNRNHRVMPNGTGLKGGHSSVQSALIIPMPGDTSRYYLFGAAHEGHITTPDRGVVYSIVDMNADGGFGDITVKNVPLIGPTTEKMVAVPHCNGTDFWVIVHTAGDNRFHAFAVTAAGVSAAPVVSAVGAPQLESRNWLAASRDGRKLACSFPMGVLELFDFDPCTGAVSKGRVLLESHVSYGVCFSPDNTKLYALHERGLWELVQFDLAENYRQTVIDTILVAKPPTGGYLAAMQLAPDGKIYCAKVAHEWLGVINAPNAPGMACNYRDSGLYLNGRRGFWGLPNVVTGLYQPPLPYLQVSDTLLCVGNCIDLADSTVGNVTGRRWAFPGGSPGEYEGEGPVRVCYNAPGVYQVRYTVENPFGARDVIRYIRVEESLPPVELSIGSVTAPPGDTVDIPLLLRSLSGLDIPDRSFALRLRFNGTMLRPVGLDSAMDVRYNGRECIVTLRGEGRGDTLGRLRALVGLGDSEMTSIRVDSLVWPAGCTGDQTILAGEFHPSGICRDGTTRLFSDSPLAAIKSARYDRSSEMIELRYTSSGDLPLTFTLTDALGRQAARVSREHSGNGEQALRLNASGLGSGLYFCTLQADTYSHVLTLHLSR